MPAAFYPSLRPPALPVHDRPGMLQFSDDPDVAEHQMFAIIFYMTAFGYIDAEFTQAEKDFVKKHIQRLIAARALDAMVDEDAEFRAEIVKKFVGHFYEVF